jgi:hypothetical protein
MDYAFLAFAILIALLYAALLIVLVPLAFAKADPLTDLSRRSDGSRSDQTKLEREAL